MVPWYVLVLISAAVLAVSDILRKHVLNHEHSLEQLAAEAPFRILVILVIIPFLEPLPATEYLFIAAAGTVLIAALFFRNRALRHMPISTVAPMQNLSPVILLVIAAVFLGERPTLIQTAGIMLVVVGGYALEARGGDIFGPLKHATKSANTKLILIFLVLISIMGTIDKYMLGHRELPVFTYLFWLYMFLGIGSVLLQARKWGLSDVYQDIKKGWYWLLLITIGAVVNISLFYKALAIPGVMISLAVPIRRTATLVETIFGGHLFHEDGVWRKALGCTIMLVGVLLIL